MRCRRRCLDNDVPDGEEEDSSMNLTRCETPSASSRSVSTLSEKYVRKRKANIPDEVAKKLLQLEEQKVEFLSNRDDFKMVEFKNTVVTVHQLTTLRQIL